MILHLAKDEKGISFLHDITLCASQDCLCCRQCYFIFFYFLRYFSRQVASDFLFLCRHLLEFQNEAWSSFAQLTGGCGVPPTFPLAPLDFEYFALPQVYTFFRWRLQTWESLSRVSESAETCLLCDQFYRFKVILG